MRIRYLLAVALIGCTSSPEPKPISSKPEPVYARQITTKTHLLYNYKLGDYRPSGYEQAWADGEKVCQSKWGLHVAEFIQPSCGTYNNSAVWCAVTFRCQ